MKIATILFALLLAPFSVFAATETPPSVPDILLGQWSVAMYDLSSMQRDGDIQSLDNVNFTVDITRWEMSRSQVNLIGKIRGAEGTMDVYHNPDNGEAQIQGGFWVFSLETGFGFIAIDGTVFTSDDGMSMWGKMTATLYENNQKKALYQGNISFWKETGAKG